METEEIIAVAKEIYKDSLPAMKYLAWRWEDEKEFEDLNDYAIPLRESVEKHGGKFNEIYGEPFGFSYFVDGFGFKIAVKDNKISHDILKLETVNIKEETVEDVIVEKERKKKRNKKLN